MSETSKKGSQKLAKLERLLIDVDVKPTLLPYLQAVGFGVAFAKDVKVDYRDDVALVRYARRYKRILVCHDRHRDKRGDRETRIRINQEIYANGGQVIEIAGSPSQHPLTSLGKLLVHRHNWKDFFDTNDGIVVVREASNSTFLPREKLIKNIRGVFDHYSLPAIPPKTIRKPQKKRQPEPKKSEEKTFDDLLQSKDKD